MSTAVAVVAGAGGCCLLLFLLARRRLHRLRQTPPPPSSASLTELDGAGIVVTGASAGIGAALVRQLAATGRPSVIIAASRSPRRLDDADPGGGGRTRLVQLPLDLSSLASVRQFVRRLGDHLGPAGGVRRARLSHLVCNAGVFFPADAASADGLPSHAAVNFVGNVALTRWLLDNGIIEPGYTRVLLVSSSLSRRGVAVEAADLAAAAAAASAHTAYSDSKQCLNLLAQHLHANLGVNSRAAFTGGPVATGLLLPPGLLGPLRPLALLLISLLFQSPERVASDLLGLMLCPPEADPEFSGRVYSSGQSVSWPVEMSPERLTEFVAGYERLVDSLVVPKTQEPEVAGSSDS